MGQLLGVCAPHFPFVCHISLRNAQMSTKSFVHKIAFHPPPPRKVSSFKVFCRFCTAFLILGPFLGGGVGAEFGEGDATKQKSEKKNRAFSLNEGKAFSE